jgi:hypothetical protein
MTDEEHGVTLARIDERLKNLIVEYNEFRTDTHKDLRQLRDQTHEGMQKMQATILAMSDKIPSWAVVVGGFMCTSIGAMAMWIITHK